MTEKDVLQELYELTMDKVFRCSGNWLMTKPKPGCEKEFYHQSEMAEILKAMIERL